MNCKIASLFAGMAVLALPAFAQPGGFGGPGGPGGADTNVDLSKLPPASTKTGVTFATDIKPIFDADCSACHGATRPSGGLRLDTLDGVMAGSRGRGGGPNTPVVIPGDSKNSVLVIAVARLNPRTAMPRPLRRRGGPGFGGPGGGPGGPPPGADTNTAATPPPPQPKNLTPEEVGLVRAWIDQGAK